ncbi:MULTISPECIES: helix-turn-helix domain-containing protein [unclassified Streptomyces]|uniref:TetR/AcrR family transcriptional regulator n=1 Tax=unclassified Streptomyces TaxID=2593676 RepID=UPI00036D6ABD|nr:MULTISPECIES: helix-turn-helix domain-containing protein [unclassified Streptomyces]MYR67497.1 TetR family transcriptional regulator [Streptomyces sp. SID4939]MYS04247.1 TetR family transcriptional regulator [Streptomyces sp. SID4940]MYT61996.1 TetR family transcriptional regulator [Streptomyces sp. SID8357]MYT85366.1 TetR family transcriptional regulator [Streptomyces sp. SID8360]MYW38939.1 TetR family transcriptional regulator [Streptomyces sp. SID1]
MHIHNVRGQLFEAAERVLLRDGPDALTSRAVTEQANCAKGVLHRHFTDFDAFLAELVLDRVRGIEDRTTTLRAAAGTGSVVDNLSDALQDLFGPVTVAIVALITFRDGLRARLREAGLTGIPLAVQGAAMIAAYLTAERELGRLAGDADIDTLAPTLVGAGHLLFADRTSAPPQTAAVRKMVTTVIAGALRPPQS